MTPEFFREYPDLEADVNMVPAATEPTPATVGSDTLTLGNGAMGHESVSRLDPVTANMFTAFPADWSTRNHLF